MTALHREARRPPDRRPAMASRSVMCPTTAPSTACRSRRRRGRCRSSMAVPFVGSHPERASGISAGYFGQPLPAAMWGLSLGWNAHLLDLDFDPTVVGIAPQPFWLHWIDAGQAGLARAGLLRPPKRWLG